MKSLLAIFGVIFGRILRYGFFRALLLKVFGFFLFSLSAKHSKESIVFLFSIEDKLECALNRLAKEFNKGIHPKHRVTRYHEFFTQNISRGQRILDLGCGSGAVAFSLASKMDCHVIAMDLDSKTIKEAKKLFPHPNIRYLVGDATQSGIKGQFEVIILSNVLEHIDGRVRFLRDIQENFSPKKILIRVPNFERSWKIPFRKELGLPFFSDITHFVEHTPDSLLCEANQAGLSVDSIEIKWGEIWAILSSQINT